MLILRLRNLTRHWMLYRICNRLQTLCNLITITCHHRHHLQQRHPPRPCSRITTIIISMYTMPSVTLDRWHAAMAVLRVHSARLHRRRLEDAARRRFITCRQNMATFKVSLRDVVILPMLVRICGVGVGVTAAAWSGDARLILRATSARRPVVWRRAAICRSEGLF